MGSGGQTSTRRKLGSGYPQRLKLFFYFFVWLVYMRMYRNKQGLLSVRTKGKLGIATSAQSNHIRACRAVREQAENTASGEGFCTAVDVHSNNPHWDPVISAW